MGRRNDATWQDEPVELEQRGGVELIQIEGALNSFARAFLETSRTAAPPDNEQTIRILLGQALHHQIPDADIRYEERWGRKKIDLWVRPAQVAVEVKYNRASPSGWSRPFTQVFGLILSDLSKLASIEHAETRYLLLVSDQPGFKHLVNLNVLPIKERHTRTLDETRLNRLATTAIRSATSRSPWRNLRSECVWRKGTKDWEFILWRVDPLPDSLHS